MSMLSLASGLRGQALLIQRVGFLYFDKKATFDVEVDSSFERSSLVAPVHIVSEALRSTEQILVSPPVSAVANLLSLLGFFRVSGASLYALFKRLKGRPVRQPSDLPRELLSNIPTEVLIAIYNDKEVQAQIRKTLEPLRIAGVVEFQTRNNGQIIERVAKSDLQAADESDLQDIIGDEEVDLGIEKAAWRRDLDWHFTDGTKSFDASIDDKNFWDTVAKGEAFAVGDRMRVHLQTTARRTRNGILKVQRRIPTVFSVEHASRRGQINLFQDRDSQS